MSSKQMSSNTSSNYKDSLLDWSVIALSVSIVITGIFWCFFHDCQNAKDLFSIFGTTITIIGLWIGIDQIARLRKEKEIIQRTDIKSKLSYIKKDLKENQEFLIKLQSINENTINDYIIKLTKVQNDLSEIEAEHSVEI